MKATYTFGLLASLSAATLVAADAPAYPNPRNCWPQQGPGFNITAVQQGIGVWCNWLGQGANNCPPRKDGKNNMITIGSDCGRAVEGVFSGGAGDRVKFGLVHGAGDGSSSYNVDQCVTLYNILLNGCAPFSGDGVLMKHGGDINIYNLLGSSMVAYMNATQEPLCSMAVNGH